VKIAKARETALLAFCCFDEEKLAFETEMWYNWDKECGYEHRVF
jgi:hypothetical protein